jgi:carbonic anhydrase
VRKHFLGVLCLLLLAACATTQPHPDPNVPDGNNDALWDRLMAGNRSYAGGSISFDGLKIARENLAVTQNPPITILSCADSRLPPELVFHKTIGDIFVVRDAGNVADTFSVASIEYGIINEDINTRMIVVLGHEGCGAVKAAIAGGGSTPALRALVARIRDGFPHPCADPANSECVESWVRLNAIASATHLITDSAKIREVVCSSNVSLRTAYYNLVSGQVDVIPFNVGEACRAAAAE